MAQSLARLHVHLVFSTKERRPVLRDPVREAFHAYLAAVLGRLGCHATAVNSVDDHVHVLFELGRAISVADVVAKLKTSSSRWIKGQGAEYATFAWQSGYGAFSVPESAVATVRAYVARQREHHRTRTFQDEFRALLARHGVACDERYVWD